jgi:hypothetical protein
VVGAAVVVEVVVPLHSAASQSAWSM